MNEFKSKQKILNLLAIGSSLNNQKANANDGLKMLIVIPKTANDKNLAERIFENEGFTYDWNEEFNCFEMPEQNLDALEMELSMLFNRNGIDCSFSS